MVNDVRSNIAANRRGCSVCYMIAGEVGTNHQSGSRCPKMPLTQETGGWTDFKSKLLFVENVVCWLCLLPTVSIAFTVSKKGVDVL